MKGLTSTLQNTWSTPRNRRGSVGQESNPLLMIKTHFASTLHPALAQRLHSANLCLAQGELCTPNSQNLPKEEKAQEKLLCSSWAPCSTESLHGTEVKSRNRRARTQNSLPAPVWAFPSFGWARWAAEPAPSRAGASASTSAPPSLHSSSHPAPSARYKWGEIKNTTGFLCFLLFPGILWESLSEFSSYCLVSCSDHVPSFLCLTERTSAFLDFTLAVKLPQIILQLHSGNTLQCMLTYTLPAFTSKLLQRLEIFLCIGAAQSIYSLKGRQPKAGEKRAIL